MKVKICGITNLSDAVFAVENGADLLGYIFHIGSPRYVTPAKVREIIMKLPSEAKNVGVFVNEPNEDMLEIALFCRLHVLQLHGAESPDQVADLRFDNVIKAVSLETTVDLEKLSQFPGCTMMIDTPGDTYGGTGKLGDLDLARQAAEVRPVFLAGGLNSGNVADVIRTVKPYGVDVSSGVEESKGIKNHTKVKNFIASARGAAVPAN